MIDGRQRAVVTGGTGFIGRALVTRLLERGVNVVLITRAETRELRAAVFFQFRATAEAHGASFRIASGDITEPNVGLSDVDSAALAQATHCFHLAAIHSLDAPADQIEQTNVQGTRRLLSALKNASFRGRFHHMSAAAIVGGRKDVFAEAMFEEGQELTQALARSKFESERLVRDSGLDYRIYRPSSVVGDSRTGEIERIDGIYHGFDAVQQLAAALPAWVRIPAPRVTGRVNVVPVDYVADALAHIALSKSEARVFHLVDPNPPSLTSMIATLVDIAGGPRIVPTLDASTIPAAKGIAEIAANFPALREMWGGLVEDLGLSADTMCSMSLQAQFDDSNTQTALLASGIRCPSFKAYAKSLFRYYADHFDRVQRRPTRYREALAGKTVLVTGASRGIGAATAAMAARAGAKVLLVARTPGDLDEMAAQIRRDGGEAYTYPTDLSSQAEVEALAESVLAAHGGIDVLVHNAAHSIRRPTTDALDRFHDYTKTAQLNYLSPVLLTLRMLPSLRERGGTISLVLTMGVLSRVPRFGAYLASKCALDAFGDVLAAEVHHDGVHVSSVYPALVQTDMMAPIDEFADRHDMMTPDDAAAMILDGVVERKRRVMSTWGRIVSHTNFMIPMANTRMLNLVTRMFPVDDTPSEFPAEHALISKLYGGSPL